MEGKNKPRRQIVSYSFCAARLPGLRAKGFALSALALVFSLLALSGCDKPKPAEVKVSRDLSEHPVSRKYQFGAGKKSIDFGGLPLSVPLGVISGVMVRDRLLGKALAEEGFTLNFHAFFKGADANFFLERGDLEMVMGGDMPAITAAAAGDIRILALGKRDFTSVVVKNHMLLDELKGRRIGYPFGSNAHYALLKSLASVDLNEEDVRLIDLNVNELAEALAQGKIDAFAAWEPFTFLALNRYSDFSVIHKSLSSSYLYVSGRFAAEFPGAARQLVASQVKALRWMARDQRNLDRACRWNLEDRKSFSGQEQILTVAQIARLTNEGLLKIAPAPVIPSADLMENGMIKAEFVFLQKVGQIPASVAWERIKNSFDSSIIFELLDNPLEYRLDEFEYQDLAYHP